VNEPTDNLEYGTVIKDGDLFRLHSRDAKRDGDEPAVARSYESRDGIRWTKPKLGLHEIDGTKENNVILHEPRSATTSVRCSARGRAWPMRSGSRRWPAR
jgi:hypothetical protein